MDVRPPGMILAGGLSRRMGRDKTLTTICGIRMVDHVISALSPQVSVVWINAARGYPAPAGMAIVEDGISGHQGPLAGLLAGLRHTAAEPLQPEHLLTVPSDAPFLPQDLVDRLLAATEGRPDRIAIASSLGRHHPVVGLWPISLANDLDAWLQEPLNRRVGAFIAQYDHVAVEFDPVSHGSIDIDPFFNVNTPEDLALAEGWMEAGR